jgi:acyl-CoA synthetase (AMP-forming)/AMP-acid ligase II/lauroyl/myristoyl acyltransferase/acyl carrier protein
LIPFNKEEVEGTIGGRISRLAEQNPARTAVVSADGALNYGDLDRLSSGLAERILAQGGPAATPVAVLLPQGVESTLAMLGIIRSGKCAVILSPEFPANRLREIWADAGDPLIVTRPEFHDLAAEITGTDDGRLDLRDPEDGAARPHAVRAGPGTPAVLLYTSGTTGEPKGVIVSHRSFLHTAWYHTNRYAMSVDDRVALIASHGFSASAMLSLYMLLDGITLHIVTQRNHPLDRLVEYLRKEDITILLMPSYTLLQKQSEGMTERVTLPRLRAVLIGGGELRRENLQRFRDFFPEHVEFSFRIASSEALNFAEMRIPPGSSVPWEKIPVGRIIADKELLLLDDQRQPVAPGETGEIAIRSRYVSDGYWGRPDLTAAKYLPDPDGGDRRICLTGDLGRPLPDGLLIHMGRKDNIVRVRGFSIQLDMVARALQGIDGIKEAAAAAHNLPDGNNRLVGYIVPSGPQRPSLQSIRNGLAAVLPAQMIPTAFVFLKSLPRTVSDRVDRQALPPPGTGRPDMETPFAPPRSDAERSLCGLWAEILQLDRVGIDDDFFLLGGDSLQAMHMVLRVEEVLRRQVPAAFYSTPTVRHLADLWAVGEPANANRDAAIRSAEEDTAAPKAGRKWTPPQKGRKFRKRYQSRKTTVGPQSVRLLKRVPRLAAELSIQQLTYPLGCRCLSLWCGNPFIVRHFYPAEAGLFRRWVKRLGGCPHAPADALHAGIMSNILWAKRFKRRILYGRDESFLESLQRSSAAFFRDLGKILADAPPDQLARFFHIEGLEHFRTARGRGRGIILVSYHGSTNRFAVAALPRWLDGPAIQTLNITHGMRLARRRRTGMKRYINEPAILTDVAVDGLRTLREGGVVQVVPDIGYNAADGVPLTIAGYRFLIRPGFAELALTADAAVVPFFSTRRTDGRIDIHILPALDPGSPKADPAERTKDLLAQYADFVETAWRRAPESLLWQVIDTHMTRPLDDN